MKSRIIVSVLLLIAVALTFTSLGYEPITVLQTTTQSNWSWYYPSTETLTPNCCCFTVYLTLPPPYSPFVTNYSLTGLIPIPNTITSSIASLTLYTTTQTLTSHIPASEALGLSARAFIPLAIAVIGVLALLTIWLVFKSRRR